MVMHSTSIGSFAPIRTCLLGMALVWTQQTAHVSSQQQPSVPEILDLLWDATDGASWSDNTGWYGYPDSFCNGEWSGVSCYDVDEDHELYGKIEILDLSEKQLVGSLPKEVYSIPNLSQLILRDNPDLTVTFENVEVATSLERLIVSRTHIESFEGIEKATGVLEELHITGCGYEGPFPMEVTKLTNLKGFFSNYNNIQGPIPEEIGQMKALRELYLFSNAITGSIPGVMDEMTKLEVLVLADNWISGVIPFGLNNLSSLRVLALSDNQIRGSLPAFDNLNVISELYLQNNYLEGSVPLDFLFNAPKHDEVTVDLTNNSLSGKFMGIRLKEFDFLNINLAGNKFEGIDELLCDQNGWMNGKVGLFGCDAIMCPIGFFAPSGMQLSDNDGCVQCASENLGFKYMGASDCGNEQKTMLRSMYEAMSGQNWFDNNWIVEEDECLWTGISCDDEGYVASIELSGFGLTGYLPVQIFALPRLTTLDLSNNFIKFQFDGIAQATNLEVLVLFNIGLDSLEDVEQLRQTSLHTLVLSSNNIDDVIPDVFWELRHLKELAVSMDLFTDPGIIIHI